MQKGIRKGFLANGMIDYDFKYCPSFINMIKILPKKLSNTTLDIISNCDILKQLFNKFEKNSIILEEFFDKLGIPNDINDQGEINTELRCSKFIPCERYQSLSAQQHQDRAKEQKLNVLEEKKKDYSKIRTKIETHIDFCIEAENKMNSLVIDRKDILKNRYKIQVEE